MDRKRKQKVGQRAGYVLLTLAAALLIIALFWMCAEHERELRSRQQQELTVIYPEIREEISDNFAYYQRQSVRSGRMLFAAVICLFFIFGAGLLWCGGRERKADAWETDCEIGYICEQLLRFQKGDFELLPALETDAGRWVCVHEKLRELDHYFSDMKERLAEEENSTKTLITDISHQLKTPLASIGMCHELASAPELSEDEREAFLATEEQEIRKMEVLLDELMKLSRLENNMIRIKPERCSLKQTISEAVSRIFMRAHAKNIEICADMEGDVKIDHDRKWTVEALANILENAVKYSGRGTVVTIRVSYLPSHVLIEIEDEGIGIPEEELHEIFKRFYRGKYAREQVKDGTGVGLYLARSIIGQQGGTIIAKRKPKSGTVFKIMLPIMPDNG